VVGYCAELDRCYAVGPDLFERHPVVSLRLAPTLNKQRIGVRWALDYEFERLNWLPSGAVAQLGERVTGSHEAAGSSPAGSIF
jgi:hypothetical protein